MQKKLLKKFQYINCHHGHNQQNQQHQQLKCTKAPVNSPLCMIEGRDVTTL